MTRWDELEGRPDADAYAARFAAAAERGDDVHGEANFVDALARRLLDGPARLLDAGCGTGRVGIELARRGHDVVGIDVDEAMLAVARRGAPELVWLAADLADVAERDLGAPFDVVVAAGNVVPLLAQGTLRDVVRGLAKHLTPSGALVTGFGLDARHLPRGCPVTPLADHDVACAAAGLTLVERWSTWDAAPFSGAEGPEGPAGYAVSVHRSARPDGPAS